MKLDGTVTHKKKQFSLRWKLLLLVVLCWMIPLLLVITTLAMDMKTNRIKQLEEEYAVAVTHGVSLVSRSLSEAIASSREASYNPALRKIYNEYRVTDDATLLSEKTYQFLSSNYRYHDAFVTTVLFYQKEPGRHYYTYNTTVGGVYADYQYYMREIHSQVMKQSETLGTKIGFIASNHRLYMMRNIVDSNFSTYAVLVMELNQKEILQPILSLPREDGVLLRLNDVLFSPNGTKEKQEQLETYLTPALPIGKTEVALSEGYAVLCGKERKDGLKLDYTVRVEDIFLSDRLAHYSQLLYLSIGLLIVLLIYVFWFSYRNILIPMKRLQEAAKTIEEGTFGYLITEKQPNAEFASLTTSVNKMSQRLEEQFKQIYSEELALRDARIMALQSQINPHFLNNTLEIINWEARFAGNEKVSHMIESLSVMLDAVTDRKSTPMITLAEELDYVDAYLYIVSQRFGNRLITQKTVDPDLLSQQVPRLILQPIVENAIEHGMIGGQVCEISITSSVDDGYLFLNIANNAPLSEADEVVIRELLLPEGSTGEYATKMGVYNVNARLKIIYEGKAGLKITSTQTHTVAQIHLPLEQGRTTNNVQNN